jgi:predicted KAP-like P-loop ATPase
MFDADRPILKSDQDKLRRATFAKYLARCMLNHKEKESVVIGLYGAAGTGKTSIINLTVEELRFAAGNMFDDEKPIILNFSPWSYSGQDQLIYSFFRRLSSELRMFPYLDEAERIIHLLELYVSFFTHKPVPKSLQPKEHGIKKFFAKEKEEAFAWESGRDLTQLKAELNELLSNQKHKIIIFIDNISRLLDEEIKQIFQIVKSIGDYVNTIYVLSMEKQHIVHALDRMHCETHFLEKIVQLPFEIPAISKQDLEDILLSRLKKLIELVPTEAWNSEHWADIYYSTLRNFFENFRDITRYINVLGFAFPLVKDVVNPVDFFALAAIYIFEPNVFYGIRDNKDLFADLVDNVIRFTKEKLAEDKSRIDEILNRSEKIPQTVLLQLLLRLFPRLCAVYNMDRICYYSEALARKNLRICSPDLFDVYFRLAIPVGYLSESEMNAILNLAHDEEGFALALMRLNQDERILRFLNLLDGFALHNIPVEEIGSVVSALMDSADLFPEGETNAVSFNTPMRIHRIFHQLLKRIKSSEKRLDIFREAIKKANKSLYIIIHELTQQSKEHIENQEFVLPIEHRDFTLNQLQTLQTLAVEKIISWAKIQRLSEHPKLLPILYAWKTWGHAADCKQYVADMVKDDKGLLCFLAAALKMPIDQAMIKVKKNPGWIEYLQNIEDFISVTILEQHAKKMFEDLSFEKLREREQLAILIFLDLIQAETVKIIPKTTA